MALVPYRVSGIAANQFAEERLFQLHGGLMLRIRQRSAQSQSLRSCPVAKDSASWACRADPDMEMSSSGAGNGQGAAAPSQAPLQHQQQEHAARAEGVQATALETCSTGTDPCTAQATSTPACVDATATSNPSRSTPATRSVPSTQQQQTSAATPQHHLSPTPPHAAVSIPAPSCVPEGIICRPELANVGMVVWQASFVLADYLLRVAPWGHAWHGIRCVDLGTGTGVVGLALALAGTSVALTDLPHITPLTQQNVELNTHPGVHDVHVVDYCWGTPTGPLRGCFAAPAPGHTGLSAQPVANAMSDKSVEQASGASCSRTEAQDGAQAAIATAAAAEPINATAHALPADGVALPPTDTSHGTATASDPAGQRVAEGEDEGGRLPNQGIGVTRGQTVLASVTESVSAAAQATSCQDAHAAASGCEASSSSMPQHSSTSCSIDLITGADVLYMTELHNAFLDTLCELSAAHTLTFLAYKKRCIGEESFPEKAIARGFAVEVVPVSQLHEEYQTGDYVVLRLERFDAMEVD